MREPPAPMKSIRAALADAPAAAPRVLWGAPARVAVEDLAQRTSLGGRRRELAGRSVLVATRDQLPAAVALLELDGRARRIVGCPPDIAAEHMPAVVAKAGVEAIVSDRAATEPEEWGVSVRVISHLALSPAEVVDVDPCETEWVLLTSGTTGAPKLIVHTLASLTAPIAVGPSLGSDVVWATFYDIRRYGGLQIKIEDRSLRIRSPRTARCYLGEDAALRDEEGFVDTGDIVERRSDRYYFLGRRSGVINVGGQKVFPEEVEAVIARHPAVRMACVRSRRSPITGSLVVADVVLDGEPTPAHTSDILRLCHAGLAPHKVPATIRFVSALDVGAAGKLVRQHA